MAVAVLLILGCSEKKQSDTNVKVQSKVVASVGNETIRADGLKAYLSARPLRRGGNAPEKIVEERLKEMITAEALYQEALRLKLDEDPEIRRSIRQMLNHRLLEEQVNRPARERKIDEQEIQKYYDDHINEYSRPEQVRVAGIFIAVPEGASKEVKAEKKKKAEQVLAEVLEKKKVRSYFGSLIRKHSDKHPKYSLGDTGFFDKQGNPVGVDNALVEAAFRLKKNGEIIDRIIETPEGFHIVMRVGKRSAVNRPLEKVRRQIIQRIQRESLKKERENYIEGIKARAAISIDDNVLAEVASEIGKPEKRTPAAAGSKAGPDGQSHRPPAFPGGTVDGVNWRNGDTGNRGQ